MTDHLFTDAQRRDYFEMNHHGRTAYDRARESGFSHEGSLIAAMEAPGAALKPKTCDVCEGKGWLDNPGCGDPECCGYLELECAECDGEGTIQAPA